MPHPTVEKLRHMLAQTADPDTYPELVAEFAQMALYVPQVQGAEVPEGKSALAMFGEEDARVMFTFTEASLVDSQLLEPGTPAFEINGLFVLQLAMTQRFSVTVKDDASEIFLQHQILLLMRDMLLLTLPAEATQPARSRDVASFYPKAYARWLGDYCRKNQDISKAWLALVLFGDKAIPDICVVFDDYASKRHLERARMETIGLLPQQLVWEYELSDSQATLDDGSDPISAIRSQPPFYDKSQSQGWWARLRRRPAPTACLRISITNP